MLKIQAKSFASGLSTSDEVEAVVGVVFVRPSDEPVFPLTTHAVKGIDETPMMAVMLIPAPTRAGRSAATGACEPCFCEFRVLLLLGFGRDSRIAFLALVARL